jgi:hypothetical protein
MKHLKPFNENVIDTEFDINDAKVFTEWCLCNKDYKFDCNGKFWFNSKTLERKSWDEILIIYYEESNKE